MNTQSRPGHTRSSAAAAQRRAQTSEPAPYRRAVDVLQPDAPRIGGSTQFVKLATIADVANLQLAPHFAMEIHVHLAAAYPHEPWVEHVDWLYPLFTERLETRDGRMHLSDRPGLGITLSEQARAWTVESVSFGNSAVGSR